MTARNVLRLFAVALLLTVQWGCNIPGIGPIGIGSRPTQADIDVCKMNLPKQDGDTLQILWGIFDNVTTDAAPHAKDDCPILTLYPLQKGHEDGSISDGDFAKRMYAFYLKKYEYNREGKTPKAKAALLAAGLPLPSGGGGGVSNPCPVLLSDGTKCGQPSKKISADATTKTFKCSGVVPNGPHTWTRPK